MKLTDTVYLVGSGAGGIGLTNSYDGNAYYIDCGEEGILIDAGSGCESERIIEQIRLANPCSKPVSTLFLTHHHGDHAGGAKDMVRCFGCRVAAPEQEADSIEQADETVLGLDVAKRAGFYPADYCFKPCDVDVRVLPGMEFQKGNVSVRVLDGAGHSLGGVCYYLECEGRWNLFAGDLLSFNGLISLQNIPGADIGRYSRSVLGLEGLHVDGFFPGHGCFSLSGGGVHVAKAAAKFRTLGVPQNAV